MESSEFFNKYKDLFEYSKFVSPENQRLQLTPNNVGLLQGDADDDNNNSAAAVFSPLMQQLQRTTTQQGIHNRLLLPTHQLFSRPTPPLFPRTNAAAAAPLHFSNRKALYNTPQQQPPISDHDPRREEEDNNIQYYKHSSSASLSSLEDNNSLNDEITTRLENQRNTTIVASDNNNSTPPTLLASPAKATIEIVREKRESEFHPVLGALSQVSRSELSEKIERLLGRKYHASGGRRVTESNVRQLPAPIQDRLRAFSTLSVRKKKLRQLLEEERYYYDTKSKRRR